MSDTLYLGAKQNKKRVSPFSHSEELSTGPHKKNIKSILTQSSLFKHTNRRNLYMFSLEIQPQALPGGDTKKNWQPLYKRIYSQQIDIVVRINDPHKHGRILRTSVERGSDAKETREKEGDKIERDRKRVLKSHMRY